MVCLQIHGGVLAPAYKTTIIIMIKLGSVKKMWTSKSKLLATYDYSKKCIRREVRVYERYISCFVRSRTVLRGSPGPKLYVMCQARYSGKVFWKHKKSYSHYCRHQNHFDINCERRLKTMTHKKLSITIFKQSPNLKNKLVHPRIPHPEENTKKELPQGSFFPVNSKNAKQDHNSATLKT